MTTPSQELRAAAEKLRRDAEAARRASPPPWAVTDERVVRCADGMIVADRSGTDHPAERADLPYIAAMHPGVGAALADITTVWANWTSGRLTTDDAMTAIHDHLTLARELGALK